MSAELHAQILSVLPLAAVHTLGNLLTNVSLGQVAVSFTHTIKASTCPQSIQRSSNMHPFSAGVPLVTVFLSKSAPLIGLQRIFLKSVKPAHGSCSPARCCPACPTGRSLV